MARGTSRSSGERRSTLWRACMTSVWGLAAIDKRSADASWPTGATSLMLGYCALALNI